MVPGCCRNVGLCAFLIVLALAVLAVSPASSTPPVPAKGVLLGVLLHEGGTESEIRAFNANAGKTHAVYAKFVEFGRNVFPSDWVKLIRKINPNCAAHIVLEPGDVFSNFSSVDWGPGDSTYEDAKNFAISCRDAQLPIYLRFAHESNGYWYPWNPAYNSTDSINDSTYIAGWRNMAKLVHENAPNVAMVWAPTQGTGDWENSPMPYYNRTYPGDDAVDWVGLTVYSGGSYGNKQNTTEYDYKFKDAITKGYYWWDENIRSTPLENFYEVYSNSSNPKGHRKPMMIAETSSEFNPNYAIKSNVTIARFDDLNYDGLVSSNPKAIDEFDNVSVWDWGPWNLTKYGRLDGHDGGKCMMLRGARPVEAGKNYVGGVGRVSGFANWTGSGGMQLWVRNGADSNATPILSIRIRSRFENETFVANLSREIDNSRWKLLKINKADFSIPRGFNWSDIKAIVFELNSSKPGVMPATLYLDDWSLVDFSPAPPVDQNWWSRGPWGHNMTWSIVDEGAGSSPHALRMNGTWGGNGCNLGPGEQNWTSNESNALSLIIRRESVSGRPDPWLAIRLDNDYNDSNSNNAAYYLRINNTGYRQIPIKYDWFIVSPNFNWSDVKRIIFEQSSSEGNRQPADLYIDSVERVHAWLNASDALENAMGKSDWIRQVYSLEDSLNTTHPYYVDISNAFPNLHMINWLNIEKFENDTIKDFCIPKESFETYGSIIHSDYYLSIALDPISKSSFWRQKN